MTNNMQIMVTAARLNGGRQYHATNPRTGETMYKVFPLSVCIKEKNGKLKKSLLADGLRWYF